MQSDPASPATLLLKTHLPIAKGDRLPLILIVGPTAVGKTEIAIQIAEKMTGEIVSADSRTFYRGMDIGTAKPSVSDRQRVPHYLIDIADPQETLSLAEFQRSARLAIAEIHGRGNLPFLVGGTGQFIRAVTQGWSPPQVKPNPIIRTVLKEMVEEKSPGWLYEKLCALDPTAAMNIDPRNFRRTIRAFEVIFVTGRKFSDLRAKTASQYRLVTIGLMRPRPELYERVDARIEAMFSNGLLEEVRGLVESGCSTTLPSMTSIGYLECTRVLSGEWTLDQARRGMKRATRRFIRRQANWFKPSDPEIRWFEAGRSGVVSEIIDFIRNSLASRVL